MKFGVTNLFECSYLPEQQERLMVFVGYQDKDLKSHYESMLANGFRRSGEQIYRPHCPACTACQSLRIPVAKFRPSKSQKRLISKNKSLITRINREKKPEYYSLYEKYINDRHQDGSMYPATLEQYEGFLFCHWLAPLFIEIFDDNKLIAVAVTDELTSSWSALYTFYDPEYEHLSLGSFAILEQIRLSREQKKLFLYLGYQIDACLKMNYKQKFKPNERFTSEGWQLFLK